MLAILTIYKSNEDLIPNAPEVIANFLDEEQVHTHGLHDCWARVGCIVHAQYHWPIGEC